MKRCLGGYRGSSPDPPEMAVITCRSVAATREMPFQRAADAPLSRLGPPEGPGVCSKACSRTSFPCKGQVSTAVLSLFKTVTYENLPNLRHFAFPLATPSARNHKWVAGTLGCLFGPVPAVRAMVWLQQEPSGTSPSTGH